jgi:excisionase family DNA binding protein
MNKLLSTKELAEKLGVTTRTIANLMLRRKIPYLKVGNRNRFDSEQVLASMQVTEIHDGRKTKNHSK